MCGRYAIVPDARSWAPIGEVFGPALLEALRSLDERYNVAPTQQVPIVFMERGTRRVVVEPARWGFVPHWSPELRMKVATFNARSEDAPAKPMWREAWRTSRCLIPATYWYEWQKVNAGKQAHALSVNRGEGFMFAGLMSAWRQTPDTEPVLTCTILTRAAAPGIEHIHDRMPVILNPRVWEEWIDRDVTDPRQIDQMLGINSELGAESFPVGKAIGNSNAEGPDLLKPDPPDLFG